MGERVFGHRANGGTGSGFISSPALGSEAPAGAQAHGVSMRKQQAAQNLSLLPASELTAQRSVATGSGLCCPEQARDCTAECGNRKQLVLPRAGTGLLVCGHAGGTARESGLDLGVLSPFFPALKPRAAARGFCSYSYLAKIVKCSLHMRLFVCVCVFLCRSCHPEGISRSGSLPATQSFHAPSSQSLNNKPDRWSVAWLSASCPKQSVLGPFLMTDAET